MPTPASRLRAATPSIDAVLPDWTAPMTIPRLTRPSGQRSSPAGPAASTPFSTMYRLSASITRRDVGEIDELRRLAAYRSHHADAGAGSSACGGYRVTCSVMLCVPRHEDSASATMASSVGTQL